MSLLQATSLGASPYALLKNPEKRRTDSSVGISFLLPGFSQWKEEQYPWAPLYSSFAGAGAVYATAGLIWDEGATFRDVSRHATVGLLAYQLAGSFSAHHAFRTMVRSRKPDGEYDFLKFEETPTELMLAPFRFDFLIRPTTLLPLAAMAFLVFHVIPKDNGDKVNFGQVSAGDAGFTGVVSYGAGTGEEALFRGTLMPILQEKWREKNPILSNLAVSGLFALAHLDLEDPSVPWVQFLGGLYLGWVCQFRDWSLAESIFIHTWYDVIVISAAYATGKTLYIPFPKIHLTF